MKSKTKVSNHQKAIDRMNRETARAIAHVQSLSKLYTKMVKEQNKS